MLLIDYILYITSNLYFPGYVLHWCRPRLQFKIGTPTPKEEIKTAFFQHQHSSTFLAFIRNLSNISDSSV